MRDEERTLDVAAVRVFALAVKHLPVVFVVVQIDGTVEGEQYDLGRLRSGEFVNRVVRYWRLKMGR